MGEKRVLRALFFFGIITKDVKRKKERRKKYGVFASVVF